MRDLSQEFKKFADEMTTKIKAVEAAMVKNSYLVEAKSETLSWKKLGGKWRIMCGETPVGSLPIAQRKQKLSEIGGLIDAAEKAMLEFLSSENT